VPTEVIVSPSNGVQYWTEKDKRRLPVPEDGRIALMLTGDTRVFIHDTSGCCQDDDKVIKPGVADQRFDINALPGHIKPVCDHPNVFVHIDGVERDLGKYNAIPFDKALSRTKKVTVEFIGENIDKAPIEVEVSANKDVEVPCVVH
jgi:hypothetical protein